MIPILYDMDANGDPKPGTTHYFCSEGCRSQSPHKDPEGENEGDLFDDYVPKDARCETCGGPVNVPYTATTLEHPKPTTEYVYRDGSPFPTGYCAMPDHWETTYTLKVRSNYRCGPEVLKYLIETKHEVIGAEVVAERCVVQNVPHGDHCAGTRDGRHEWQDSTKNTVVACRACGKIQP